MPSSTQTSTKPPITRGVGSAGSNGKPSIWKILVWAICHGRNFRTDRTKACFLLKLVPWAFTTLIPAFRLPHVACLEELSCSVKYKITGRIRIRNAATSLKTGEANTGGIWSGGPSVAVMPIPIPSRIKRYVSINRKSNPKATSLFLRPAKWVAADAPFGFSITVLSWSIVRSPSSPFGGCAP